MKTNKYLSMLVAAMLLATTSCSSWLDQEPMSNVTTGAYFKNPAEFEAAANGLYNAIYGWATTFSASEMGGYVIFDQGTDLNSIQNQEVSGIKGVPTSEKYYSKPYEQLRQVNNLLEQAEAYTGNGNIDNSVGSAYFFRAWWHYFLLCRYGGISLMTSVPNTQSNVVWGPRNSRYEVVASILTDLDNAQKLVSATKQSTNNNGSLTIEAVCAFKARVCLYEGTWEKYNGRGSEDVTNGDGITCGAGTAMPEGYPSVEQLLTMAKTESGKFVAGGVYGGEYSIWMGCEENNIPAYQHQSAMYLYALEGSESNPNGLTKESNSEAIFRRCYDFALGTYGKLNLTHSRPCSGSRKLMDMYLCTDGLPINISPLFKGYKTLDSEFENRDARMRSLYRMPGHYYWSANNEFGKPANFSIAPKDDPSNSSGCHVPELKTYGQVGYAGRKFTQEAERASEQESSDYLHIRLPEMLLVYAEATYELDGQISDADIDKTINVIRQRAHIAKLTNVLVSTYGLDMKEEIRRERALELFGEGFRVHDLCRWNIADKELARPTCSYYVRVDGAPTDIAVLPNPVHSDQQIYNKAVWEDKGYVTTSDMEQSTYTAGMPKVKAGALILETQNNRLFSKKNYLKPIPSDELDLNDKLKQNPQ